MTPPVSSVNNVVSAPESSLSSSPASESERPFTEIMQDDWTVPAPPPLYHSRIPENPGKRFPGFVFGWPLSYEDQVELADKLNVSPGEDRENRVQHTWKKLGSILPPEARRATAVRCELRGHVTSAMCIYIATNVSRRQRAKARNEELVRRVCALLQIDTEPQWLRRIV